MNIFLIVIWIVCFISVVFIGYKYIKIINECEYKIKQNDKKLEEIKKELISMLKLLDINLRN